MHPNKGSLTPRGHIGSEILREAEGVLAITVTDEIRTLTSDFEHGKARNTGHATTCFEWSDEEKIKLADLILINDDITPLLSQIESTLNQLV